jgi:hypothetical protein
MLSSVAVLAVGLSGGAALASDSPQSVKAQIQACYKPGQNPSGLELLTKGSCPKGFSKVTWNVQGPAGPAGPTGTFGSVTTYSASLSVGPDEEGAIDPGCPAGSAVITGGVTYGGYTAGVSIVADVPSPASGTPTSWLGNVANVGTSTVTMTVSVVCATPAGTAGSSAQASKEAVPPHVKGVIVPLQKARAAVG